MTSLPAKSSWSSGMVATAATEPAGLGSAGLPVVAAGDALSPGDCGAADVGAELVCADGATLEPATEAAAELGAAALRAGAGVPVADGELHATATAAINPRIEMPDKRVKTRPPQAKSFAPM